MTGTVKPCPFCQSTTTEKRSDFSTSLMVALYYCKECRSLFEAIKWGDQSATPDLPAFLQHKSPK